MRQCIVFKGNRNGLKLLLDDTLDFQVLLTELSIKLESAMKFFAHGADIRIPGAEQLFSLEQQDKLKTLLNKYGLALQGDISDETVKLEQQEDDIQTLVIAKTLRGGQEVIYDGAVIVFGDVNPGAKIVAGGDIFIHGICRGLAHAGAKGNIEATITAKKIYASQLRIGDIIARAPDQIDEMDYVNVFERARVNNSLVIIEPACN